MRFLMKVSIPNEQFNAVVKNGSAGKLMQDILGELKPEAAYFAEFHGKRTGILIIHLNDAFEMPRYAEPWFMKLNAEVEFHPVMLPDDLGKAGLEELGKKWG